MEQGAINNRHERIQKEKMKLPRSKTFPSMSHPQRAASGQAINQQESSSIPSFPTYLDQGASGSLNAGTSQGGSVEISVEESSPSEDFEYQTNGRERPLAEYRAHHGPLIQATKRGDWRTAKDLIEEHEEYIRATITKDEETVLHIAVGAKCTTFVKELLKMMKRKGVDAVELKKTGGLTALHSAARSGIVGIAKQLVEFNQNLLLIPDDKEDIPLNLAATIGDTNMISYLFSVTPLEELIDDKRVDLLDETIYNGLYDIALKILKVDPNITRAETFCGWRALEYLAIKPLAIGSESQLPFWKTRLNSCFKMIYNKALMKTLAHQLIEKLWNVVLIPRNPDPPGIFPLICKAAKFGNVEFLNILASARPDLIWQQDEKKMTILHIAILFRQESVYNLIYEISTDDKSKLASYTIGDANENMLHLVGYLAPPDRLNIVSGAALQMQRELLWFKEIEKIVPPRFMNEKNSEGKIPKEIFINCHKKLQEDAVMWMKNASNNCMVVATLIAAVAFAAAFTVPGGNNQEMGTPILLRNTWYMIFFISNAIALFSSTASILFFLSMFVSRYSVEDFSVSVPSKLLLGLATLFISIGGMIVAFSAACILMYRSASSWAPVVASALVGIPLTLFSMGHCHELFVDLFVSQYQSRFLFGQPYKRRLIKYEM